MRRFNTGGPCISEDHYMLPTLARLPMLQSVIDEKNYFVIHAPRQIGKTTLITNLAQELTSEGKYAAAQRAADEDLALSRSRPARRVDGLPPPRGERRRLAGTRRLRPAGDPHPRLEPEKNCLHGMTT
jgi:hypothetical protein